MSDRTPPTAESHTAIRANAELVYGQLNPLTEFEFGFNDQSLDYLDGYLNGQYEQYKANPQDRPDLASVMGCFLGEYIVHTLDGQWVMDDQLGLSVQIAGLTANPFGKVQKILAGGWENGESVASFVRAIPAVIAQRSA